MRHYSRT